MYTSTTAGTAPLVSASGTTFAAPSAPGYLTALWMPGSGISPVSPALNEPAITPSLVNYATNAMWQLTADGTLTGGSYDARFNNRAASVTDFNQTTLLKRANSSAPWALEGTHVATTGSNTSPVIGRNGLSGFSEFAIGGNLTILPVVLKSFGVRAAGPVNLVDWTTGAESGIAAYVVERSANGKTFGRLGEVAAGGSGTRYSFTDGTPLSGAGYYRLQIREDGGQVSYSNVASVTRQAGNASILAASLNPFTGLLTIRAAGQENGEIVLTNAAGAVVARSAVSGGRAALDLHSLPAGEYFAVYTSGDLREVLKVQKR